MSENLSNKMNRIKLVFAADIIPTETNERYFISGDTEHLFGKEMLSYLSSADFRCFNLEVPLTDKQNPASYPGPILMAKPETVCAIKKLNPSLLTIGNNHALDQGVEGCENTMAVLNKAEIPFTGAGKNLQEAQKAFYSEISGVRIGIFNCSEYEFAAATATSCGANPYDPLESFDLVKQMKDNCDYAVVLYHGGKEFYRYPSPQVQRICRKFADYGADVVICQHTHCVGCEEKYKGSTLVYGQGNFLLDRYENELKSTGVFVEMTIEPEADAVSVAYIPFVKMGECVRMASETAGTAILDGLNRRSEEIKQPGFIEESYSKLADEYYESYLRKLLSHSVIFKIVNRLMGRKLYRKFLNAEQALKVLNIISPENHRELFMQGLRNRGSRY